MIVLSDSDRKLPFNNSFNSSELNSWLDIFETCLEDDTLIDLTEIADNETQLELELINYSSPAILLLIDVLNNPKNRKMRITISFMEKLDEMIFIHSYSFLDNTYVPIPITEYTSLKNHISESELFTIDIANLTRYEQILEILISIMNNYEN
jgi:hypothetical protein